jgi:dolichol-phosphate mannosyltransferase
MESTLTATEHASRAARRPRPAGVRAGTRYPSVTVVVPTYREVESIPHLAERLAHVRENERLDLELLLMDDDSRDGSSELVARLALSWVHLVTRTARRSLSLAVLDGLRLSQREFVVVMDADLSHPPEAIPRMLRLLDEGADVVVGSRFVTGGSTADDWGVVRWLNSRIATVLAAPLTRLHDPMSGFFALRRATFEGGRDFAPVGYKILLELIIKCRCQRVVEIPIHFDARRFGQSKLTLWERLRYLQHLRRLYVYKYGTWSGR